MDQAAQQPKSDPSLDPARFRRMSDATELRRRAGKCRQLAEGADERTAANLLMLAAAFEAEADEFDPPEPPLQ